MYASPQTSGKKLEETLEKVHRDKANRAILPGDLNARHKAWDKLTDTRAAAVVRFTLHRNYKILPPENFSYKTKGLAGESRS